MESKEEKQKVIAVACVRNAEGKFLVQKRIDPLIRECKEETGCVIEIVRVLPLAYNKIWQRNDGIALQAFIWSFEARYISGEPKPLDKKVSEVKWCSREELMNLDALPGTHLIVEAAEKSIL